MNNLELNQQPEVQTNDLDKYRENRIKALARVAQEGEGEDNDNHSAYQAAAAAHEKSYLTIVEMRSESGATPEEMNLSFLRDMGIYIDQLYRAGVRLDIDTDDFVRFLFVSQRKYIEAGIDNDEAAKEAQQDTLSKLGRIEHKRLIEINQKSSFYNRLINKILG